ncbi:Methylenetetrahydrofolate dehydrogenase [NAD(+)] [Saitoella coloradoensis]
MATTTPSTCRVVLAANIAAPFIEEVKDYTKDKNAPLFVGFLANDDPWARQYAEQTGKTATDAGFTFELRVVDKEDLEEKIMEANIDENVTAMMVYWPVFGTQQDKYLQQCVAREKDVEGLSHVYVQNMYHNIRFLDAAQTQKSILPCTPLGVVKILEYLGVYNNVLTYGNRLYGKTITVVNRSEVVGRPLAALLANDGATVYSVDITGIQKFTRGAGIKKKKHEVVDVDLKLEDVAPQSDVIITGVPGAAYKFPTDLVKEGAICVNFSTDKNFDPSVKERAAIYVPATGKVTIAMLLRNLVRLYQNQQLVKGVKA